MRWIDWTGLECAGCLAEGSDGDGLTGRLVIGANDCTIGEAGEALSVRLVSFVGAGANALAGISTCGGFVDSVPIACIHKIITKGPLRVYSPQFRWVLQVRPAFFVVGECYISTHLCERALGILRGVYLQMRLHNRIADQMGKNHPW